MRIAAECRRTGRANAGVRSLLLVAALAGCAGTDMVGPGMVSTNIPAVGMSSGQFGFAVAARDWTYDQSYQPDLASGTLQIGLVIAGYTGGVGELSVTDASGASVFSQSLAGNLAEGNKIVAHGTAPFHVRVTTARYTGTISLGISPGVATASGQ